MPELPEVETIARQLAPLLRGRKVAKLRVLDPKLAHLRRLKLGGWRVEEVSRVGKQVLVTLGGKQKQRQFLCIHLRMTGRLIWCEHNRRVFDSEAAMTREDSFGADPAVRLRIEFDSGVLLFSDVRRFGTVKSSGNREVFAPAAVDPTSSEFTPQLLRSLLIQTKQPLKTWLLRQDRLVGIGNIYASEILYAARVSPDKPGRRVSAEQLAALHRATRRILLAAIRHCGTTFSDFRDSHGDSGGYQRFLKVYDRQGQTCRRCGGSIERTKQGGRSTYYCPGCQR